VGTTGFKSSDIIWNANIFGSNEEEERQVYPLVFRPYDPTEEIGMIESQVKRIKLKMEIHKL
jgi:hypothetical protein